MHPIHEIVKVDYYMPGCPPSGDVFWKFLSDIIAGQEPSLPYDLLHFD
ncbi:[similarity to] NADH ubiquinone oxidoreductase 20 kDa subunit [methanotrophic bacterial endosymbiont of Bathymodiolus sp.]|nr:[similarity to] NADH ubiquinone oxidoreductase 20 kDa subunit [methanotrophic bacterial endosymbiont of Bathymodiolus sp.]